MSKKMDPATIMLWLEVAARVAEMIASMFPEGTDPQVIIDKTNAARAEGVSLNATWAELMEKKS